VSYKVKLFIVYKTNECISRLVELSHEYPIIEDESEEYQNSKLKSVKLIKELGKQEKIESDKDLKKVTLGDFCITPKCKKCLTNTRECEHRDNW
jgi:hypothetical protein